MSSREKWQLKLEPLLEIAKRSPKKRDRREWEIPRVAEEPWEGKTQELFFQLKSERARNNGEKTVESRDGMASRQSITI